MMKVRWNQQKRQINIKKHGVDFADLVKLFESPLLTAIDDRFDYGEDRWIGIGSLDAEVYVVVFVDDEQHVRLISARKANSYEQKKYYRALGQK